MKSSRLVDSFQRAKSDPSLAVIEGVQALKHAFRFDADISKYITCDIDSVKQLLDELADDITYDISSKFTEVSDEVFAQLNQRPHRTKVMALARRRAYKLSDIPADKPIIFLEGPKDLENVGAVIRVAAAANAGAVVISGPIDVWHPAVIRGAAGLQWALPVFDARHHELSTAREKNFLPTLKQISRHARGDRQTIALNPTGEKFNSASIPDEAVLIFGTERHGITQQTLDMSDQILRLPMKDGVSSLNLATSVAATLYQL